MLLLAAGTAQADERAYLLGGGFDADADGGFRGGLMAGIELGQATWLSGGLAGSSVELPSGRSSDIAYGDIDLDHYFDPLGISVGAAYWGDSDLLDSVDRRVSLYYRNERFSIAGAYEYRDFDFIIPPSDFFEGREFAFDADGFGGRLRYKFTDRFSMSASAMQYDYNVNFRPGDNLDAVRLVTVSRLSLISSLIDSRASVDLNFDVGSGNWELDYTTWKGALDQSRTHSVTVLYLRPLTNRTDIEFGLGYDDSDLYGDVTFFSLYLYFYGS